MSYIKQYQVVNHGIEHPDYFQGCGASGTDFTHVFTGCGSSECAAFDDALEQAATVENIKNIDEIDNTLSDIDIEYNGAEDDRQYYVSIRFNLMDEPIQEEYDKQPEKWECPDCGKIHDGIDSARECCQSIKKI